MMVGQSDGIAMTAVVAMTKWPTVRLSRGGGFERSKGHSDAEVIAGADAWFCRIAAVNF